MRRYFELQMQLVNPCLLLPHQCITIAKIVRVCKIQPILNIHIYAKPQKYQVARHCQNKQLGNTLKYIPCCHSSEDRTVLPCSALCYIKILSLSSRFLQLQHVEVNQLLVLRLIAIHQFHATTTTIVHVVHDATYVCKSVLHSDF